MRKILVIDNEDIVCQTCRSALAELSYEFFCADEEQACAGADKERKELSAAISLPIISKGRVLGGT